MSVVTEGHRWKASGRLLVPPLLPFSVSPPCLLPPTGAISLLAGRSMMYSGELKFGEADHAGPDRGVASTACTRKCGGLRPWLALGPAGGAVVQRLSQGFRDGGCGVGDPSTLSFQGLARLFSSPM